MNLQGPRDRRNCLELREFRHSTQFLAIVTPGRREDCHDSPTVAIVNGAAAPISSSYKLNRDSLPIFARIGERFKPEPGENFRELLD
jgi:hypothetical protein